MDVVDGRRAERMLTVAVVLPADLRARAEQRAAAERRSLSGFLRNLIEDRLGPDEDRVVAAGGRRWGRAGNSCSTRSGSMGFPVLRGNSR
jgi:hypothetical protein